LRTAILTNPHSSRNRRHLAALRATLARHSDIQHVETASVDAVGPALAELLDTGVDLLAINGGDGTIHLALCALLAEPRERPLPKLALLPGGTTNMSARDINGVALPLRKALAALLSAAAAGAATTPRYVLRVSAAGEVPQFGLCFGIGAIVRGIEYCHERIFRLGMREEWATGVALLRAGWGIARREAVFAEGVPLAVTIDGETHDTRAAFLLVSALAQLLLGIHPFWGDGCAPLRVTLVREHAERFLRSFPDLLRGRAEPHLREDGGYLSRRGTAIEIVGDCPYTIDGEIYHAASGRIRVDAFGPLQIVPLGGAAS
jgi:diacylglycerol kinase (ATP)